MSAHAIGSANVSFGLVSVPVKMFSTGESSAAISFNWLHKKDNSRLKQEYVCSKDGEKVEKDDRIKGWEYTKGRYVTFTVEEIKALEEKGTGAIDIREFISADKVDRIYYDRAYFLGPDKGGERAYALLSKALTTTNLVALGQYVARGKQYLIMVRPLEEGLVMEQLRYADEVRSIKDVELPRTDVKATELEMAIQLIKQLTAEAFRPETYEDVAKKRIMEQIQRKIDGKEITEEPTEAPKTQILDLMEALKASIAQGKDVDQAPRKRAKRTA